MAMPVMATETAFRRHICFHSGSSSAVGGRGGGCCFARLHRLRLRVSGRRRGALLFPDVTLGQRVLEVEGEERLLARPRCPLHQQLQLPRLGRIKLEVIGNYKNADFA